MSQKILNSRIVNKHDVEANWKLATNFKPLLGELIIYDPDDNYSYSRFKIGNGKDNVNDLDFTVKPSPTPDWNQNDETAPDYIKNRPFYVETGFIEILPERIIQFDEDGTYTSFDIVDVSIGNTYVIKFGGVEYTCIARAFDMGGANMPVLGNLDAILGTGSSDEPFVIVCVPSQYIDAMGAGFVVYTFDPSYSHLATTISIKGYVENFVHKIDKKFLPDNVGGIQYVNVEFGEDELIADATYDQITEWIMAGIDVRCLLGGKVFINNYSDPLKEISPFLSMPNHHEFVSNYGDFKQEIVIYDDNTINYNSDDYFLEGISYRLNFTTPEDLENAIAAEAEVRAAEDAKKLDKTGGEMTGTLTITIGDEGEEYTPNAINISAGDIALGDEGSHINNHNIILNGGHSKIELNGHGESGTAIKLIAGESGLGMEDGCGLFFTDESGEVAPVATVSGLAHTTDDTAAVPFGQVNTLLNNKVDKVSGKGLSTNDYTTNEKTKLNGIEAGAQKNTITGVKGSAESSYRTGDVNITAENVGAVPTSRTINNKVLSSNITLSASDVGAYTKNEVDNRLNLKQDTITGAATSITTDDLTEGRALVSSTTGKVVAANTTAGEIGFLSGVKNNVQTQLDGKVPTTRTVNNKALSSNITLSAGDVGAYTKTETDNAITAAKNELLGTEQLVGTYDTLKEIGAWIETSGVDATELSNAIAAEAKTRADEDAKKLDKTGEDALTISKTDEEVDSTFETVIDGQAISFNDMGAGYESSIDVHGAYFQGGNSAIVLNGFGESGNKATLNVMDENENARLSFEDENGDACGVVSGLIDATSDDQAVPYGQMKEYVNTPNPDIIYSATPLVTAEATNFSGVTYTGATEYEVEIPNVEEIFVGMQITVIPAMKSATDKPYIVVNGQRSRIYTNASTTSSYFNGTSVDFIAENKPMTLMYMGVVSGEVTGWKCLNSVRVNVESMMSTGVTPNGYIATAPGTSGERLVWKSPAVLGKCINEDSILTASSTDGVSYTVDIPYVNYSGLYKGLEITIIPNKTSASTAVTLNANNLGAKDIRLTSASSSGTYTAYGSNFLAAGKPVKLMYNGEIWKTVDINRPVATALSGQVEVKNGGTGRDSLTSGYYLVGNGTSAVALKAKSQVLSDIGAVPTTRTVNGKALSSNITLSAGDVDSYTKNEVDNKLSTKLNKTGGIMTGAIEFNIGDEGDDESCVIHAQNENSGEYVNVCPHEIYFSNEAEHYMLVNTNGLSVKNGESRINLNGFDESGHDVELGINEDGAYLTFSNENDELVGVVSGLKDATANDQATNLGQVNSLINTAKNSLVPTSRTVNGKALSSNITLSAGDVGAVPTSRTINGKALSSNITLAASDVSAAPAYTYGTTDLTHGSSTLATGTLYFVYE